MDIEVYEHKGKPMVRLIPELKAEKLQIDVALGNLQKLNANADPARQWNENDLTLTVEAMPEASGDNKIVKVLITPKQL